MQQEHTIEQKGAQNKIEHSKMEWKKIVDNSRT